MSIERLGILRRFFQKLSRAETRRGYLAALLRLEALEERIVPDDSSAGAAWGINARDLKTPDGVVLTGDGVWIGQLEANRPGKPGLGFDSAAFANTDVRPEKVFSRMGTFVADKDIHWHALTVAGVMIADGARNKGVAPEASLVSDAGVPGQTGRARSAQQLASQNNTDVQAINFSFGMSPGGVGLNGTALLTRFVDWSAVKHDTLYVVAGNEDQVPSATIPSDEYNGLTVHYTQKDEWGVFRQIHPDNNYINDAAGARHSADLVAPGAGLRVPDVGNAYEQWADDAGGTSDAAPHVTGAAALLREYADNRIDANAARWDVESRNHLVAKTVLMNSADKLQDAGDGKLLGMETTILKQDGSDWTTSDARDVVGHNAGKAIPTDLEMGTGQLNVSRAVKQFSSGNSLPANDIPPVGWFYGNGALKGSRTVFTFDEGLRGGSHVSVTLAWDSKVDLVEKPGNANFEYDIGESFTRRPLADFDVGILPANATLWSQAVWTSESADSNAEHIFFEIPNDGDYKIWVERFDDGNDTVPIALAWWSDPLPDAEETASIGDAVWIDSGLDGTRDSGEAGVSGMLVDLYRADGSFERGAYTQSDGSYSFDDVEPGDYYLRFNAPAEYAFTLQDVGSDATDSDADAGGYTAVFTVGSSAVTGIDAGLVYAQPDVYGFADLPAGPLAGGNVVLIEGTGFTSATDVTFGPSDATSFTVVSDVEQAVALAA